MQKSDDPTRSTEAADEEGFLGRWSRRKRLQREGGAPVDEPPLADAPGDVAAMRDTAPLAAENPPPADEVAESAEVALTDADMPALDTLGEDDDYSGFLSPGVSEALRTKALRQLFKSSQFNVLDGLNDYDDDFTSFEPLGDIVTSDMRHRIEVQAERAAREAEEKAQALLRDDGAGATEVDAREAPEQLQADPQSSAASTDPSNVPGNVPGNAAADAGRGEATQPLTGTTPDDVHASDAYVPGQGADRVADSKLRPRRAPPGAAQNDSDTDADPDANSESSSSSTDAPPLADDSTPS